MAILFLLLQNFVDSTSVVVSPKIFYTKFLVFDQNFHFWPIFNFRPKFPIFNLNFQFWSEFPIFDQNCQFSTKLANFIPNVRVLDQTCLLGNLQFLTQISIFHLIWQLFDQNFSDLRCTSMEFTWLDDSPSFPLSLLHSLSSLSLSQLAFAWQSCAGRYGLFTGSTIF